MIFNYDWPRLIVILEDIIVELVFPDKCLLDFVTLELNGETHLRTGKAPGNVGQTSLDAPRGGSGSNTADKLLGIFRKGVAVKPSIQLAIIHHDDYRITSSSQMAQSIEFVAFDVI
jgi:hypothetical protein